MREIAGWTSLSPPTRRAITQALEERKAQILDRENRAKLFTLPDA